MKDYNFSLDYIFNMGYYEAHRLWLISSEIKFRELEHFSKLFDYAFSSDKEQRGNFLDWLKDNQPRRYNSKNNIPKEVLEKFAAAFNMNKKKALNGR